MQYTEYLGLKKPESTDFYNVGDFNSNADAIDTKLKELENGKAPINNPTFTGDVKVQGADGSIVSILALKDYVVKEIISTEIKLIGILHKTIKVTKDGYTPLMATCNAIDDTLGVWSNCCSIKKDGSEDMLTYSLYETSGITTMVNLEITVLYVRNI